MNLLLRILAFLFGGFVLYAYLQSLGQDHSLTFHVLFCIFIFFMFWSVWHLNKNKNLTPEDRKPWLSDTASVGVEEAASFNNNWYIRLLLEFRPPIALFVSLTVFYLCPWDLLMQTSMGLAVIQTIQPPSTEDLLDLEFATYAIPFVSVFNTLMAISLLFAIVYSNPMPAYIKGRVKTPYLKLFCTMLGCTLIITMVLYILFFSLELEVSTRRRQGLFNIIKSNELAFASFIYAAWYTCHALALSFFCLMKSSFVLLRNDAHT